MIVFIIARTNKLKIKKTLFSVCLTTKYECGPILVSVPMSSTACGPGTRICFLFSPLLASIALWLNIVTTLRPVWNSQFILESLLSSYSSLSSSAPGRTYSGVSSSSISVLLSSYSICSSSSSSASAPGRTYSGVSSSSISVLLSSYSICSSSSSSASAPGRTYFGVSSCSLSAPENI